MGSSKPMIRHCYNCEWCIRGFGFDKCDVLYISISDGKKKAKRCKFFTMTGAPNKINNEPPKPPTTGSNAIKED